MIFGKTDWFSIITGCFLLLMVAAPASASPFPVVIRGTILEMNETDQTLLLQADCEHAWCQVNVTGMYTGRIPGTAVLSTLNTGEMVEAVFNAWYMDLHDPSTGYVNPSDDIRDIRRWGAIQKLAYGNNTSEFKGTDLFGDPVYLAAPLASGYSVAYDLRGPPPQEYDFRITPPGNPREYHTEEICGGCRNMDAQGGGSVQLYGPFRQFFCFRHICRGIQT